MLIVTRKTGQKIMINDDIEITVVETRSGSCKIAVEAPRSYKIYREEIYVQIKLANLMGQDSSPDVLDQASELLTKKDVPQNTQPKFTASDDEVLLKDDKKDHKTRVFIKKQNNNDNV